MIAQRFSATRGGYERSNWRVLPYVGNVADPTDVRLNSCLYPIAI